MSGTMYADAQERLSSEIIWEGRCFSGGTYVCRVERREDRSAKLTVTLLGAKDHQVHQEPVTLKIDPTGGPLLDVEKWKTICDAVIDQPRLRSSTSEFTSPWFQG